MTLYIVIDSILRVLVSLSEAKVFNLLLARAVFSSSVLCFKSFAFAAAVIEKHELLINSLAMTARQPTDQYNMKFPSTTMSHSVY